MFKWGSLGFLDCYRVVSEGLVAVFEWAVLLGLVIFFFILLIVVDMIRAPVGIKYFSDSVYLEFIWTLLPLMVLVFLGYPSMVIMFMVAPDITGGFRCGVLGFQWYWSYKMSSNRVFSYIRGGYRLLDVDMRLVLPSGVWCKIFISSGDVIHS